MQNVKCKKLKAKSKKLKAGSIENNGCQINLAFTIAKSAIITSAISDLTSYI